MLEQFMEVLPNCLLSRQTIKAQAFFKWWLAFKQDNTKPTKKPMQTSWFQTSLAVYLCLSHSSNRQSSLPLYLFYCHRHDHTTAKKTKQLWKTFIIQNKNENCFTLLNTPIIDRPKNQWVPIKMKELKRPQKLCLEQPLDAFLDALDYN